MQLKTRLNEEEKLYCIMNMERFSNGKIGADLNRSRHTIYSFIKRFKERNTLVNKKSKGRPMLMTNRILRKM